MSPRLPTPEGPFAVSGAPSLPDGCTDTFASRAPGRDWNAVGDSPRSALLTP